MADGAGGGGFWGSYGFQEGTEETIEHKEGTIDGQLTANDGWISYQLSVESWHTSKYVKIRDNSCVVYFDIHEFVWPPELFLHKPDNQKKSLRSL